MKTKLNPFFLGMLALVLLALLGFWLLAPRQKEVATILIEAAPAQRLLAVNGRIRPRLQVDIRPALGGELVELPFDVGDHVAAGQIIARIDDAPETATITEAEASMQAQQATVAQARRDLARFEALGQFATKREVEQRRLAVVEGERELSRRRASVGCVSAFDRTVRWVRLGRDRWRTDRRVSPHLDHHQGAAQHAAAASYQSAPEARWRPTER